MILSKTKLIWLLSFVIILEVVWLDFRLNKLRNQLPASSLQPPATINPSFAKASAVRQLNLEDELKNIPEPSVLRASDQQAKLWLEPKLASVSGNLNLKIWLESNVPIDKADLRIFFPPQNLKLIDENWQVDFQNGVAIWSGELGDTVSEKELITKINFKTIKPGKIKVEFDYSDDSLLDCNLWDSNHNDILGGVENGEYYIGD